MILIILPINRKANHLSKLNVLSLNCCSLRSQSKRAPLQATAQEHQADIIIGCESHIDNKYSTAVIRKDHCNEGGGVFLAAKCNLCLLEQPTLHSDAEIVWAKLCIDKHKPIYIRMLILQATYVCT